MSTAADVKGAKALYEDHCQDHRCRTGKCPARAALFVAWQKTAAKLGR